MRPHKWKEKERKGQKREQRSIKKERERVQHFCLIHMDIPQQEARPCYLSKEKCQQEWILTDTQDKNRGASFIPFEICLSLSFVAARCILFQPSLHPFFPLLKRRGKSHKKVIIIIIKSTLGRRALVDHL